MKKSIRIVYCMIIIIAVCVVTQLYAYQMHYHQILGEPLFIVGSYKMYNPIDYLQWNIYYQKFNHPAFVIAFKDTFFVYWIAAILIIALEYVFVFIGGRKLTPTGTHGIARWATVKELIKNNLINNTGVVIGQLNDAKYTIEGDTLFLQKKSDLIADTSTSHILMVGPTGSGKGGPIQGTLLNYSGSVLTIDPKGENWELTSGFRSRFSNTFKLDFTVLHGACCNPILEIRKGRFFMKDVQNIMGTIFDIESGNTSEIWQHYAYAMATTLLLYLIKKNGLNNVKIYEISDVLKNPEMGDTEELFVNMGNIDNEVIASIINAEDGKQFNEELSKFVNDEIKRAGFEYSNMNFNTLSSITKTLHGGFSVFADPLVRKKVSKSNFSLIDLKTYKNPVSLYIVIGPDDMIRLRPLLKMIINQASSILCEKISSEYTKTHQILFLIDEFTQLGKMPIIELGSSIYRGYGIKLFLAVQTFSQLYKIYGKQNPLIDNCQIQIVYGTQSEDDSKLIADMTGTQTLVKTSTSKSKQRGSLFTSNKSESESEVGRKLLDATEVKTLPKDTGILFVSGMFPYRFKKIRTYLDPRFKEYLNIPLVNQKGEFIVTDQDIVVDVDYEEDSFIDDDETNIITEDDITSENNNHTSEKNENTSNSYFSGKGVPS